MDSILISFYTVVVLFHALTLFHSSLSNNIVYWSLTTSLSVRIYYISSCLHVLELNTDPWLLHMCACFGETCLANECYVLLLYIYLTHRTQNINEYHLLMFKNLHRWQRWGAVKWRGAETFEALRHSVFTVNAAAQRHEEQICEFTPCFGWKGHTRGEMWVCIVFLIYNNWSDIWMTGYPAKYGSYLWPWDI